MSGGYTGVYVRLYSLHICTLTISVLYVLAYYISKKNAYFVSCKPHSLDQLDYWYHVAVTKMSPHLMIPVYVTVPVPTSVPLPPIPALPFASRAMILVFSRFLLAQVTTLPGIPLLVTLNACCPSPLFSGFRSPFPCLVGSLPYSSLPSSS